MKKKETLRQKIIRLEKENASLERQVQILDKRISDDSWNGQVDTMSGAHTQAEIDATNEWR